MMCPEALRSGGIQNPGRPHGLRDLGTADGIRTHDLQSRSLALYPAELQPQIGIKNLLPLLPGFGIILRANGIIADDSRKVKTRFQIPETVLIGPANVFRKGVPTMQNVVLGRSGLVATKPALGCLPLQRCTKEYAVKLIRSAYEGGIRFFDTANAYTDSEEKLGIALHDVRSDVVISTKSAAKDKEGVLKHIENSLRMLQTDYIDLFQFHQVAEVPDAEDPNGPYAGALEAKKRGWIGHIGVTSHRVNIAEDCIASGNFETVQFPFSYISSERDLALAEKAKAANVGYLAMKGLAGGMLTNARVCHAFMKKYDNVVPLWGMQTIEQLEEWLAVAEEDPDLDAEMEAFIAKEREELSGSFCRSCGYCMPCPMGIEIRNCARMNMLLRRSPWQQYMTEEWYAKMHKIEDCIECRSCASKCPYQLDTPNLLKYMLKDYDEFYASHKDLI